MIYNLLKNLINAGRYKKEQMMDDLDVFFAFKRITLEQYTELMELLEKRDKEEK